LWTGVGTDLIFKRTGELDEIGLSSGAGLFEHPTQMGLDRGRIAQTLVL
jgi:hypothetical protein